MLLSYKYILRATLNGMQPHEKHEVALLYKLLTKKALYSEQNKVNANTQVQYLSWPAVN